VSTPQSSIDPDIKARDRELLIASKKFASEKLGWSWWHFASTLTALLLCASIAALGNMTWLRALGSLLTGLLLVRFFILYHDYQHQSFLKDSRFAGFIMAIYGYLMLTPPSVWRRTHDHHHRHNSKMFGASIGSFPILTTTTYRTATWLEKLEYHISRNPLVIICGYFTVFMLGMSLRPLFIDFKRHWDALLALGVHFGFIASCVFLSDWFTTALLFLIPTWIATTVGSYLFYAQHNFPGAKIRRCDQWTYTQAALQSSSFLEMGRVMHWLTGNIGYHHVHHLNAKIPFYRLPEAMKSLPELQSPTRTSFRIRDIINCLRLKLWDDTLDQFVTFSEARRNARRSTN
jgi:acyl-lipid omega-6 desaturase (Delta-12 desaturase)